MKRRKFITALGGALMMPFTQPSLLRAQERVRRVAVIIGGAGEDDVEGPARKAALEQGLAQAGFVAGRNLRIDYRYPTGNPDALRRHAAELVALSPDVIVSAARHPCPR